MSTETIEFQAEARQLLQLMIHSIYSTKDVFLRELISNSSDALDKLRLAAYQDKDLEVDTSDLHIAIEIDSEQRTLTVRDNGIGMTRDEVVELIGTIAKSGTAEMLGAAAAGPGGGRRLGGGDRGADRPVRRRLLLQLHGRRPGRAGHPQGRQPHRRALGVDGGGHLHGRRGPGRPAGHRRHAAPQARGHRRRAARLRQPGHRPRHVKRYSDFITWPIRMASAGDGETETVNSRKALWARPQSDVSEEEYTEFYRHVSHDWREPLETIRLAAEGTFEYQALLFLPSHAPMDLFMRDGKRGVQLYVKRVFIMDDCEALVPEYLRFVKGVVDANDLSLNISREILQQDRQIQLIRKRLVKKVLSTVKTMQEKEPEKYATFWSELGRAVKEGLLSDHDNRKAILEICSFPSTHDPEKPTTLRDYLARMPEGQDAIYYATGESRAALESSPHMEAFRAKGYEVLLLTDPIDEVWVDAVPSFEEKPLTSIATGEVDLGGDEVDDDTKKGFDALLAWMASALDGRRQGGPALAPADRVGGRAWSATPAT